MRRITAKIAVIIAAFALSFATTAPLAWADDAPTPTIPLAPVPIEALLGSGSPAWVGEIPTPSNPPEPIIYLDGAMVQVADQTFSGVELTPAPIVTLGGAQVDPEHYSVRYDNNVNVGTGTVTIVGTSPYAGVVSQSFAINPAELTSLSLSFSSCTYDGTAKSPDVTVYSSMGALVESVDYKLVKPTGLKAAGSYVYTAQGIGNYTGNATATLTIGKAALSKCAFGKLSAQSYTGRALKPEVNVRIGGKRLKAGTDYKLSYSGNKAIGSAKVKVTGIGSCTGSKTLKFNIKRANVSKASVKGLSG